MPTWVSGRTTRRAQSAFLGSALLFLGGCGINHGRDAEPDGDVHGDGDVTGISVDLASVSFGLVGVGDVAYHVVRLTNESDGAVVAEASVQEPFAVSPSHLALDAYETAELTVSFAPGVAEAFAGTLDIVT